MSIAPGRNFLKVASILYIIVSVIGLALAFFMLPELSLFIRPFLSASYFMFVGIMGVKYCKAIEKANFLCIIGIIALIVALFNVITFADEDSSIAFFVGGLVIPILFLVGSYKNRLPQ